MSRISGFVNRKGPGGAQRGGNGGQKDWVKKKSMHRFTNPFFPINLLLNLMTPETKRPGRVHAPGIKGARAAKPPPRTRKISDFFFDKPLKRVYNPGTLKNFVPVV
jgi:hypothetical protein